MSFDGLDQKFFQLSGDLLCVADFNGFFKAVNPAWENTTGWTLDELKSQPFYDLVHPDDRPATQQEMEKLKTGSPTYFFENRYRRKDGVYIWLSWKASVSAEDQLVYASARDVTSEKKLYEELSRAMDLNECITTSMAEGFTVQDSSGKVIQYNEAACAILGLTGDQLLGHQPIDAHWRCVREDLTALPASQHPAMVALKEKKPQFNVVIGIQKADGQAAWVQINAVPFFMSTGAKEQRVLSTFSEITELKNARFEALLEEKKLRMIFENVPMGLVQLDARGRFLEVNRAFSEWIGYSFDELKAMTSFFDISYDEEITDNHEKYEKFYAVAFKLKKFQKRFKTKDGRIVWGQVSNRPYQIPGTIDNMIFAVVEDITAQKAAENEMWAASEWRRAVLDASPYAIISTNTEGVIQTFNAAAEKMLGYKAEEMVQKQTPAIFHDFEEVAKRAAVLTEELGVKIEPGFDTFVSKARMRSVPDENEWTYIRGDKTKIPVRLSVTAFKDFKGVVTGYLGISQDLSAQKAAEEDALLQRRRLDAHLHALNLSAIVVFTDLEGTINYVNDKYSEVSGYSKEELMGRNHRIVKSNIHNPEFFRDMWKTISSKKIWRGEVCNKAKDGKLFWLDTTIVPLTNNNGDIEMYIGIKYDITQKRATELTLVNSAKMSSLGEMAGGIAHEINNPLAIIQGKADLLTRMIQNETIQKPDVIKSLEKITETTKRIAKIIGGLKTFSRNAENDPFAAVSLRQIISDTITLCHERFKNEGIELRVVEGPDERVECRATQISQVLLNLLNNSFDAICAEKGSWVELESKLEEGKAIVTVTDSGSGIPPEIAAKIMQPFFTTKEVGKGTGLGLSISKGIIEDHGGKFYIDTKFKNTRFVVELPLKQEPANAKDEKKSA